MLAGCEVTKNKPRGEREPTRAQGAALGVGRVQSSGFPPALPTQTDAGSQGYALALDTDPTQALQPAVGAWAPGLWAGPHFSQEV